MYFRIKAVGGGKGWKPSLISESQISDLRFHLIARVCKACCHDNASATRTLINIPGCSSLLKQQHSKLLKCKLVKSKYAMSKNVKEKLSTPE